MKLKKIIAVILSLACPCVFSSCMKQESEADTTAVQETMPFFEETTYPLYTETQTVPLYEGTTVEITTEPVSVAEATTVPESTTSEADEASSWGAELVAAYYKKAATDTGSAVKSRQTIELKDISVNNGALGGVFRYVTPILSKFLSGSATETDGITGNFSALDASDVAFANAYKGNGGIVIEMTLNEQSDKASADASDGSVGHAISVVGDLGGIMNQLNEAGLPLEVNIENAVITYRNPVVKVLVDDSGKIVNGTWSCEVEINLSNYKFAGAAVDSTVVVLLNTITVGGGFNG